MEEVSANPPQPPPLPPGGRVLQDVEDIEPDADGTLPWWKPGWSDVWKHMGWGYATALIGLGLVVVGGIGFVIFWGGWAASGLLAEVLRLSVLVAAIAVAGAGVAIKRSLAKRDEPFCIHCGYSLAHLPDHYVCPECGRPYSFALIDDYRTDPEWFIMRWRRLRARKGFPPP
jgi:hypothetical protein